MARETGDLLITIEAILVQRVDHLDHLSRDVLHLIRI